MPTGEASPRRLAHAAIWLDALGYFAAYVPYSALTKAVTSEADGLAGVRLLPSTALASFVTAALLLLLTGWWRRAGRLTVGRVSLPVPGPWTLLSGLCSAVIIASTTLAYTFGGISIVFMMLIMRGGVLVLAPLVDRLARRKVSARAWLALSLSLAAVVLAAVGRVDLRFGVAAAVDVGAYLLAYFVRLRAMSHVAKTDDADVRMRYFVEEQLVSTPALLAGLALLSVLDGPAELRALGEGFSALTSVGVTWPQLAIGVLSQGTGVFGALVLLQPHENSFCVPVNRASSILAGVLATALLALAGAGGPPDARELSGAGILLIAVGLLAWPRRAQHREPDPARWADQSGIKLLPHRSPRA